MAKVVEEKNISRVKGVKYREAKISGTDNSEKDNMNSNKINEPGIKVYVCSCVNIKYVLCLLLECKILEGKVYFWSILVLPVLLSMQCYI